MDLVRDGGDQAAQEVSRGATRHLLVHLDEGELRRSVDGDEQVELALRSQSRNRSRRNRSGGIEGGPPVV